MINPYESPRTPPEPSEPKKAQAPFQITVVDVLVLLAILAILIAMYLPANQSGPHHRRSRPQPPPIEEVQP